MFILDTDIFTLLVKGHPRVVDRNRRESAAVALTVITRIEVLQGRFASMVKAATGEVLLLAQARLQYSEGELAKVPIVFFEATAATEFDRLRQDKKVKKIGRADLLIAAIALAQRATLVTRNLRDFRQVPGLRVENWAD
jgi:tRNA(fMet)-specific endonuclease VapC